MISGHRRFFCFSIVMAFDLPSARRSANSYHTKQYTEIPFTKQLKLFRIISMDTNELRRFASWLGRRSYAVRVERLGIERIREKARENGKKGGRPPKGKRGAR